ncbi:hypothetical protein [Deinococcus misasensis]|uniref:hypothetical protein n=1 Tax=Deinococcus misasensis TaxID=392413 RepID=UPI000A88D48D|nr:hypothetical protein [Deinococcus misasensis]
MKEGDTVTVHPEPTGDPVFKNPSPHEWGTTGKVVNVMDGMIWVNCGRFTYPYKPEEVQQYDHERQTDPQNQTHA